MASPVHRIEPRMLTVPQFYGSPGEPQLGRMPTPSMPPMSRLGHQAQGPSMGGMIPLAALAALLGKGGNAQAPQEVPLSGIGYPDEKPNNEPLDVMPDSLPFKTAFAKARKMGLVEFTWRGKPYTTELKDG